MYVFVVVFLYRFYSENSLTQKVCSSSVLFLTNLELYIFIYSTTDVQLSFNIYMLPGISRSVAHICRKDGLTNKVNEYVWWRIKIKGSWHYDSGGEGWEWWRGGWGEGGGVGRAGYKSRVYILHGLFYSQGGQQEGWSTVEFRLRQHSICMKP